MSSRDSAGVPARLVLEPAVTRRWGGTLLVELATAAGVTESPHESPTITLTSSHRVNGKS